MSFRRDGKKANVWRERLETHSELLSQARLPDCVFVDEMTWFRFLLHGYHLGSKTDPPSDVLTAMSEDEKLALYRLLSVAYSDQERVGMCLWDDLRRRFDTTNEV